MIEAKKEKEEEETQNIYIHILCAQCSEGPICWESAYMRNAVNYLCAQYHHFLYNVVDSHGFGIGVKVPYVLRSIYQESKQMNKKNNKSSNNNGIFIQTIYKLHSLNLNEGDALLLHLWCVFARNMYLRSSQPQFISAFSYEKWPTWVICDLLSEKLTKLPRQEKSNKLLTIQQIALSPTLIRLVNIFSFPYEDNKKNY